MPKFTDKVDTTHNYNKIRHLMKGDNRMSDVLWELSLRGDAYRNDEKESQKIH